MKNYKEASWQAFKQWVSQPFYSGFEAAAFIAATVLAKNLSDKGQVIAGVALLIGVMLFGSVVRHVFDHLTRKGVK